MSIRLTKRLMLIGSFFLLSIGAAPAQTPAPSPDAMAAARTLVTTLKLSDQYRALLPAILLGLKPALTQDRPELERDFDAMLPSMAEEYAPYYTAMIDGAATVYASNFTAEELRDIEAFYSKPAGQKLLQRTQAITQQVMQVGQDIGRKASDGLRTRLSELLRQRGHKL
jgi:hypothetical protein